MNIFTRSDREFFGLIISLIASHVIMPVHVLYTRICILIQNERFVMSKIILYVIKSAIKKDVKFTLSWKRVSFNWGTDRTLDKRSVNAKLKCARPCKNFTAFYLRKRLARTLGWWRYRSHGHLNGEPSGKDSLNYVRQRRRRPPPRMNKLRNRAIHLAPSTGKVSRVLN